MFSFRNKKHADGEGRMSGMVGDVCNPHRVVRIKRIPK